MLFRLEVGQPPGLAVDVLHLSGAVNVELGNLLAGRRVAGLLKVAVQAREEVVGALGDAVVLVGRLGAVCGLVLLVQVLESAKETRRDAVLLVQLDGALDRGVTDHVAVCQILGQDASAGLHLLRDLVVGVALSSKVGAVILRVAGGAGHGDVVGAELCVVEQESCLHGRLLLKGHFCAFRLALGGDFDIGDFAAMENVSTRILG